MIFSSFQSTTSNVDIHLNPDPHVDLSKAPRRSNPLSFLSKGAFVLATAALFTVTGVITMAEASTVGCVCDYDPQHDYFPNKLTVEHSSSFKIEYFNSYKKLTVMDDGHSIVYLLHLCGTPAPQQIDNNTIQVEIPIRSAAASAILFVSYVEYLGERNTLHSVGRSYDTFKPCLRKMYDEHKISDASAGMEYDLVNASAYARTGRGLDIAFLDNFSFKYGNTVEEITSKLGEHTKPVYVAEQLELTAFGKVDWLKFVAAFYNKDGYAQDLVEAMQSKYNCIKNMAAAQPKLRVLFGYCYYSVPNKRTDCYVAICPNYYCDWIRDAGGVIPASKQQLTVDEMYSLAETVDVWIYNNANWNESSMYVSPFFIGEIAARFSQLDVVKNKRVYDMLGENWASWFEDDKTDPVTMLLSLVQALHGKDLFGTTPGPKFFRNVQTEPKADQEDRLAMQCVNETALVYAESFSGFCATGEAPVLPNNDTECSNNEQEQSSNSVSFTVAFFFVLLILIVLGVCFSMVGARQTRMEQYEIEAWGRRNTTAALVENNEEEGKEEEEVDNRALALHAI